MAEVPNGTPANPGWHVVRARVMHEVCQSLRRDDGPRVVGLVGNSGAGKTTAAAALVRSDEVRELFSDGILWFTVGEGAQHRLASLMTQLAKMVHEDLGGSLGHALSASDDVAAYISDRMSVGNGGQGLKCLVVVDNVWEAEVITKVRETGMWILVTTRDEGLVKATGGQAVVIDTLSEEDARSVLRRASELPTGVQLPHTASEIIDVCGRVAMDLAFVGRWSSVRKRQDPSAWSRVAVDVRKHLEEVERTSVNATRAGDREKRRLAVLRAGLRHLGAENDDVEQLYLALGVLPDGRFIRLRDAAVLLHGHLGGTEDQKAVEELLQVLERWSILRAIKSGGPRFIMHDAHSSFARKSLMARGDIRQPVVERWVAHLCSLDGLIYYDIFSISKLLKSVEAVGDKGCCVTRPFDEALSKLDESDAESCGRTLHNVGRFYEIERDLEGAIAVYRRLLNWERKTLGRDHREVAKTCTILSGCSLLAGKVDEAREWHRMARDTASSAANERAENHEDMEIVFAGYRRAAEKRRSGGFRGQMR